MGLRHRDRTEPRQEIPHRGLPGPKGVDKAAFPLMKTSFAFKGGLNLENTLTRSCEAKG
jgi:hypothetical protein